MGLELEALAKAVNLWVMLIRASDLARKMTAIATNNTHQVVKGKGTQLCDAVFFFLKKIKICF